MRKTIPAGSWFKYSYSGSSGNCVEVAHTPTAFRKSSYSADQTECVEIADWPAGAAIRDTQHRDHGALTFNSIEWRAFLNTTKPATPSQW